MEKRESEKSIVNCWKLLFISNSAYKKINTEICDIATLEALDMLEIENPNVPGCFELDYMRQMNWEDIFYAENILKLQTLENLHSWYYTTFDVPADFNAPVLVLEGIDTAADIYINSQLVKSVENMHIPYEIELKKYRNTGNELVIHIKPIAIETRKYHNAASCNVWKYNDASIHVRKSAHSFGWDIFPRALTSGIFKPVYLKNKKSDRINEVFLYTTSIDLNNSSAELMLYYDLDIDGDFASDYTVKAEGSCGESRFCEENRLWHTTSRFKFNVNNYKLWWPKNYGQPDLYDVAVSLLYKGKLCDKITLRHGIRKIELITGESDDALDTDKFNFRVNGKDIFIMGTNWVPPSPFPCEAIERTPQLLPYLNDLNCNILRIWGGATYPEDVLYDFCDENGILVWQDFAMACAVYPNDNEFFNKISEEFVFVIKRLRNHPSLAVWCGDNECDYAYQLWGEIRRDPNTNRITRELIPNLLNAHDFTRSYLPSSPYISKETYINNYILPETHVWGPREWFKQEHYKGNRSRFVSETGYFGATSTKSTERFISPEQMWPYYNENGYNTEWLVHASGMENTQGSEGNFYAFRIEVITRNVVTLFGKEPDNYNDFAKQSQISHAEALKYYIERIRIRKGERTGIMWWNLADGWPQLSDAIIDYYGIKKLAYSYIKRSQQPVCLMFDEPIDDRIQLYGVNDTQSEVNLKYKVTRLDDGKELLNGSAQLAADLSAPVAEIEVKSDQKDFLLIEWEIDGKHYTNHYFTNIIQIDYEGYLSNLEKCGYACFEGMED